MKRIENMTRRLVEELSLQRKSREGTPEGRCGRQGEADQASQAVASALD